MAAGKDVVEVHLAGVGQEFRHLGLPVGRNGVAVLIIGGHFPAVDVDRAPVLVHAREQSLAVEAVPPESGLAHPAAEGHLEVADVQLAGEPSVPLADVRIVVVAVLVADPDLLHLAVRHPVIQVVLGHVGRGGIVALGEGVHVVKVLAAQQVVHPLVVLGPVHLRVKTSGQGEHAGRTPLEVQGKVQVPLVRAALLQGVLGPAFAVLDILLVHGVEAVPVDMGILRKVLPPGFLGPGGLHPVQPVIVVFLHEVVAREVPVVVRTRVLGVVPVQGGVPVLAETVQEGRGGVESVGRGEVVLEDGDGFVRLADAGIAHLPVLVAPVGVVHVVVHEVIDLLGRCVRRTALSGRPHDDRPQLMHVVELLLDRGIVREGTVVHTFHPVVSAQTGRHVERVGPAVVLRAGGVGQHQAQPVQLAVGEHAPPPSLADGQGVGREVRQAVVAADAVVGNLRAVHGVLGAGGFIKAAPQGEGRVSRDGVVHLDAREVHVLGLGGVSPHPVTDGTEIVSGHVVEHVVLPEQDGGRIAVTGIVHVELHQVVRIDFAHDGPARQGQVEHVLDISVVDGDVDPGLEELGSLDYQVIHAIVQVFDEKAAVRVRGRCRHPGRPLVKHKDRVRDRTPVGTADHRSPHTARKRLGAESQAHENGRGGQG